MSEMQFSAPELQLIYAILVDCRNDALALRRSDPTSFGTNGAANLALLRSSISKLRTVLRTLGIDPRELEALQSED